MSGIVVKRMKPIWIAALSLMIGASTYLLWRPNSLILFQWGNTLGLSEVISKIRQAAIGAGAFLPPWVIYSLPDASWIFAYSLVICTIWKTEQKGLARTIWLWSPILLGVGYELLQLIRVISGTFCVIDTVLVLSGAILGWICQPQYN